MRPNQLPSHPAPLQDKSLLAPLANSLAPLLSAERGSEELALAILDRQRGLTPAQALNSPQLSALRKADPGGLAEALGNLLTFTASQINVVRNLSETQLALLVNDLLERYWMWKIDEFVYLFKEAVTGRWGKFYDRLDSPVVHEWCRAYGLERDQVVADSAEQEAQQYKRAERTTSSVLQAEERTFNQWLEGLPDEILAKFIDHCQAHPEEPYAARKLELAELSWVNRQKLSLLRNVVPDWSIDKQHSMTTTSEAGFKRYQAELYRQDYDAKRRRPGFAKTKRRKHCRV